MSNHHHNLPLHTIPLKPSTLAQLVRRGFETTKDVLDASLSMTNFAEELGVDIRVAARTVKELREVLDYLNQSADSGENPSKANDKSATNNNPYKNHHGLKPVKGISAAALLTDLKSSSSSSQNNHRPLISFSRSLDTLLGGGFAMGEVTEIVGEPGVGKTNLAMQLAVNARIPSQFGGVGGEAIYIDTEGSFAPERCLALAEALVSHVESSAARRRQQQHSSTTNNNNLSSSRCKVPDWFQAENILRGIHVFRVHDEAIQTTTIYSLSNFINEKQKKVTSSQHFFPIKLIIIDSIAFHYRSNQTDFVTRTRSLSSIASFLSDLSRKHHLSVLVVNQMTTKVVSSSSGGSSVESQSKLVPALGETWAHSTTTRLLLSKVPGSHEDRMCTLVKSPHRPAGVAHFTVLEVGIRDVRDPDKYRRRARKQQNDNHDLMEEEQLQ